MSKSQSLTPSPITAQHGGHSFCKVYDAYSVFPPSCCAQLRHLRGRGMLVAIKNCTQIVNARFRTRSCLLLFMLFPALHLRVYERLHLKRGID